MDLQSNIPISNGFKTFMTWVSILILGIIGGPISFLISWLGYHQIADPIQDLIPRLSIWFNPLTCLPYLLLVGILWWSYSKNSSTIKASQLLLLVVVTSFATALTTLIFIFLAV